MKLYMKQGNVYTSPVKGGVALVRSDAVPPAWTEGGKKYVRLTELAVSFERECKRTGMRKKVLAERCGVTPVTFANWISGRTAVPDLAFRMVKELAEKVNE